MSLSTDIIQSLRNYQPRSIDAAELRPAAVLVPISETPRGDHITLIERAAKLPTHGGEIAFPGGSVEPSDKDALAAALRETQEEIGVDPANVQIIGQLDQVSVAARYLVTPFIGIVSPSFSARPNELEVKSVMSIPVSALLNPKCCRAELVDAAGKPRAIYHFHYEGLDIWGATARILKQLLEVAYGFRAK
jgi:8-oxo-dGTP pyrophosphatase MutT (NUDIX family)